MKPKYVIDKVWLKQNEEKMRDEIFYRLRDPSEFLPDKWYEEAQWIIVTKTPDCQILVPKFSMWIALPDESNDIKCVGITKKYWKIFTPYGELRLHLNEAHIVDITKYADSIGIDCHIKFLNKNPEITDNVIKERIFYIRSRGIGKIDAMKYVLGDLKDPQLFYIVFRKEYQEFYCRDWEFVGDDVEYREAESIVKSNEEMEDELY